MNVIPKEKPWSCALCGSFESGPAIEKSGYRYAVCSGCGVASLDPLPDEEELNSMYEDFMELECDGVRMADHFSPGYREAYFREKDLDFEDVSLDLHSGMRVLDVGCADGIFLRYLKERFGIDGDGIDVSGTMVAKAVAEGFNCSTKRPEELSGPYDLITLWDTLEHLRDPVGTLKILSGLLSGSGEVVIQTPCRGILSDAYGPSWIQYQPPYHVHIYDLESLGFVLREAGLEPSTWVRFGAGITDDISIKPVFDSVVKKAGIGDTIVMRASRAREPERG